MSVRAPAVAGQFYPDSPTLLDEVVRRCLELSGEASAPGRVAAILAPHAGYPYSGVTAAHAFARVRGKQPGRVVLLGRSHRFRFEGASLYTGEAWETPLGRVPVDVAFATALAERIGNSGEEPHGPEHGLEVEVPFLQVALGTPPIVPVLFGAEPDPWHVEVGEQLAEMLDEDDLVLISTDLSHFLDQEAANALDQQSLKQVCDQDCAALIRGTAEGTCSMCGATAVVAGMACALARGARDWRVLDYRTSAEASGDYARVVGYAALSMEQAA